MMMKPVEITGAFKIVARAIPFFKGIEVKSGL